MSAQATSRKGKGKEKATDKGKGKEKQSSVGGSSSAPQASLSNSAAKRPFLYVPDSLLGKIANGWPSFARLNIDEGRDTPIEDAEPQVDSRPDIVMEDDGGNNDITHANDDDGLNPDIGDQTPQTHPRSDAVTLPSHIEPSSADTDLERLAPRFKRKWMKNNAWDLENGKKRRID